MNYPPFQGNVRKFLQVNDGETDAQWVVGSPAVGVLSVTDDGNGFVTVDNTDPQAPIIDFDYIALAGDELFEDALIASTHFTDELANDSNFVTELVANDTFTTDLANSSNFIDELLANFTFVSNLTTVISGDVAVVTDGVTIIGDGTLAHPLIAIGGGGGGGGSYQIDQTPDDGTYGLLAGDVDGVNTTYEVSLGSYQSGKLQVYLNGLIQLQGMFDDWEETDPSLGTFDFTIAPLTDDIITVVYTTSSGVTGEAIEKTFSQTAHGFTQDQVLKSAGTDGDFALAEANLPVNSNVVGIVVDVVNANSFVLATEGFITLAALPGGAIAGDPLFLDPSTPGALTLTEPTVAGEVSQPLAIVIDASLKTIYFHNWRPQENQAIISGAMSYFSDTVSKDASDASTTQVIPHGLPVAPLKVKITAILGQTAGSFDRNVAMGLLVNSVQNSASIYTTGANTVTSATFRLNIGSTNTDFTEGVITADATDINIAWTKNGNPTGVYQLIVEAETQN